MQSFLESYIKFCLQLTLDMLEYFVLHRVESLLYSPPKKKCTNGFQYNHLYVVVQCLHVNKINTLSPVLK